MRSITTIALLACLFSSFVNGIYFVLEDGQTRCFIEEVPKDTLIMGRFKAEDISNGENKATPSVQFVQRPGFPKFPLGGRDAVPPQQNVNAPGIKVVVSDPQGAVALQRGMPSESRFALTSQLPGEYKLCFQTNSTGGWFGGKRKVKLHLDIETGEEANDYEDVAKQEHLSDLELQVRKLTDRIKDIRQEQNYQRNREAEFRNTSESTNSRVVWWSIAQTAILVSAGLWQITHLKNFFKTKKLV